MTRRSISQIESVPGIAFSKDRSAFTFSHHQVPASAHFFRANDVRLLVENGEVHILFGQRSLFESQQTYKAAVEISMPVELAYIFLVENTFNQPSAGSTVSFAQNLQAAVNTTGSKFDETTLSSLALPNSSEMYRAFSSNYSSAALSRGQGMIEFFEANPALVANLVNRGFVRNSDGLKHVIAVILPLHVMNYFFIKARELLLPFKSTAEGIAHVES